MAGVVGTTLGPEPLEPVKRDNPNQPPVPAGVSEGGQFGSGTRTTNKPPKDKPEDKPDDAKIAQQLTGAAIDERQLLNASKARRRSRKVAEEMKCFFNMDRNDVVQLGSRIEGNNFIGDMQREVKPGESFFGVSYASLRVAKFDTVDVDAKGHGTLHPARWLRF